MASYAVGVPPRANAKPRFLFAFGPIVDRDTISPAPTSIAISPDGAHIWTCQEQMRFIRVFHSDGTMPPHTVPVPQPWVAALDTNGEVFVSRGHRVTAHRIVDGKKLRQFGSYGTSSGQFGNVFRLAVDGQGLVYVADNKNHRIQVFNRNGTVARVWKTGFFVPALAVRRTCGGRPLDPLAANLQVTGDSAVFVANGDEQRIEVHMAVYWTVLEIFFHRFTTAKAPGCAVSA